MENSELVGRIDERVKYILEDLKTIQEKVKWLEDWCREEFRRMYDRLDQLVKALSEGKKGGNLSLFKLGG
jgi:hypothetical protein